MPIIAIKGSVCSGHGDFPPRSDVDGESLLTINGIPVMVDGNAFAEHTNGDEVHAGTAISTRPWWSINGKGVVCVDDPVSCGSTVATGDALVEVS
ncbi:alanine racemase [Pantoea sp. LMR881]|uniref:PAAR domain-containing protein n=1 Tax=Pantoea sp. LMR881 TaxID=3014336 RepID=UPI0022AEE7D6|nr:PAAR domain-containing protein [Pantoea sp. LMR881]MCZ4061268.1 alanine racemase [Pantoea sp. LMR881]